MPQILQVLRCFKCLVFQVHQTKKSNKWVCKMCGEKQSIKRHYGIGTGRDCRMHVQKLNKMQAEKIQIPCEYSESDGEDEEENEPNVHNLNETKLESKWTNYLNEPKEVPEIDEPMYLDDQEVVLEIPKKTRMAKKRISSHKNYPKVNNDNLDCGEVDDFGMNNCKKAKLIGCMATPQTTLTVTDNGDYNKSNLSTKKIESSRILQPSEAHSKSMNLVDVKKINNISNKNKDTFSITTSLCDNTYSQKELSTSLHIIDNNHGNLTKTQGLTSVKGKNSKWAQFIDAEENVDVKNTNSSILEDSETDYSQYMNINCERYNTWVNQSAHKSLKQDLEKNISNDNSNETKTNNNENRQSLFSMIDEKDLDSILDF